MNYDFRHLTKNAGTESKNVMRRTCIQEGENIKQTVYYNRDEIKKSLSQLNTKYFGNLLQSKVNDNKTIDILNDKTQRDRTSHFNLEVNECDEKIFIIFKVNKINSSVGMCYDNNVDADYWRKVVRKSKMHIPSSMHSKEIIQSANFR